MKKVLFYAGSLLMFAACTKDQTISDRQGDQGATLKESSVPPQNVIHILSSGFSPDSLMVNVNSTVAWVNDDKDVHTVTSDKFDSGDIAPGDVFKYAFDNTGSYFYSCRYHPTKGLVVVAGIR